MGIALGRQFPVVPAILRIETAICESERIIEINEYDACLIANL
ncbi:MAG: hypothetical protein SPL17_09325 [Bacteroidales bacterium]|nr:hypothetical protein [Bacteroidales bacterium]